MCSSRSPVSSTTSSWPRAVWLSGRRPAAALVAVAGVVLVQPVLDVRFVAVDLVVVLVAYRAAAGTTLPPWQLAGVTFTALTVHDWWLRPLSERAMDPSLLYPAMVTALAIGLGLRTRRVAEQALELLRLQHAERDRAVSEERHRIARDLHDVAAHHLSALVVHNRLAQRLATEQALTTAVEFSAVTASETLDSLRHVVGTSCTEADSPRSPTPFCGLCPPSWTGSARPVWRFTRVRNGLTSWRSWTTSCRSPSSASRRKR